MSYGTAYQGEEPLKQCSSRFHAIAIDRVDCCMACIRRRRKIDRSWKRYRKTKWKAQS